MIHLIFLHILRRFNISKKIFNFKRDGRILDELALPIQIGLTMAGSILFCGAIGYFIDKWLGIRGPFITIFIFAGVIGGAVIVYRQIGEVVDLKGRKRSKSKADNERD